MNLARRIALLDARPYHASKDGVLGDLGQFVSVMSRITAPSAPRDLSRMTPTEADHIVDGSRLLARLEDTVPEIVSGPVRLDPGEIRDRATAIATSDERVKIAPNAQYWTSWGAAHRTRRTLLDPAHFVGALDVPEIELSTKPFRVGLFTSTGVSGTYGMWRLYLERFENGMSFSNPRTEEEPPWYTWIVDPEPDAAVLEIACAADWVDLVTSHPRWYGNVLYPDWKSLARGYDGVHMTLRAIAATQGIYFPTARGEVAPTFWDVEATFWLRWRFRAVRLVDVRAQIAPWLEELEQSIASQVPFEQVLNDIDRYLSLPGAERQRSYFESRRACTYARYGRSVDECARMLDEYLATEPDVLERVHAVIAICAMRPELAPRYLARAIVQLEAVSRDPVIEHTLQAAYRLREKLMPPSRFRP